MRQPRTIDSGSHDFADAINEAENARHFMAGAIEAKRVARFYSGDQHGIPRSEAEVRIGKFLADSVRALDGEQRALRRLNAVLLHAGGAIGDEFLVGRGIYRVCSPGQLAVYLGRDIPTDEMIAAFDPFPSEPDDRADDFAAYSELVRIPD